MPTPLNTRLNSSGRSQAAVNAQTAPLLEPAMALSDTVPIDALQVLFAMLDPWVIAEKYRGFARLDPNSERARMFVALEDWLNDGVPLAASVARGCLADWYGANAPMRGEWRIAGEVVEPAALRLPFLLRLLNLAGGLIFLALGIRSFFR